MCGIVGIYNFVKGEDVDKSLLKKMCDKIVHRGPDDAGYFTDGPVGLGMRRLSIIDLNTGKQPIFNEDRSMTIVFNGEIYNYKELRERLEKKGHEFYTDTDTETIIHAYEEYGSACLKKVNGMFAFAIWDSDKRQLFIARDRLGIKPLYYYFDDKKIVFASEIKSILEDSSIRRVINKEAVYYYFVHEFIPSPLSIFKGIHKLEPGHFLLCNVSNKNPVSINEYWDVDQDIIDRPQEYFEKNTLRLLKESVERRMISDVPLGAFLSGGIDSSAICALMSKASEDPIKTFSIGFGEQSYDETSFARSVAEDFGTDHTEYVVDIDASKHLPKINYYFDEPFSDVSNLPTYLVSQMTRKHVTVALSGDGGDELFAGYDRYRASKINRYYLMAPKIFRNSLKGFALNKLRHKFQKRGFSNTLKRFVAGSHLSRGYKHMGWQVFPPDKDFFLFKDQLEGINGNRFVLKHYQNPSMNGLNKQLYTDLKLYLPDDILTKVDRMSMAHSLEARVPFLDHNLVEFSYRIPPSLKLKGMTTKYILKKSLRPLLPKNIINRKKEGFSMPVKNWLRTDLVDLFCEKVLESKHLKRDFFSKKHIKRMFRQHRTNKADFSHELFALLNFALWHENFMGSD